VIDSILPPTKSDAIKMTVMFLKSILLLLVMGKTGTTTWIKIKGRKGQTRLVPGKWQNYKPTGPNQKYDSRGKRRRRFQRSQKSILGVRS
jgi:hypothetical protein